MDEFIAFEFFTYVSGLCLMTTQPPSHIPLHHHLPMNAEKANAVKTNAVKANAVKTNAVKANDVNAMKEKLILLVSRMLRYGLHFVVGNAV